MPASTRSWLTGLAGLGVLSGDAASALDSAPLLLLAVPAGMVLVCRLIVAILLRARDEFVL